MNRPATPCTPRLLACTLLILHGISQPHSSWAEKPPPLPPSLSTEQNPEADSRMGHKKFREGNYQQAMIYLRYAEKDGDLEAAYLIGLMYYKGLGMQQPDLNEARKWLIKAAWGKNIHAQILVGGMFESGTGVTKDIKNAIKWYGRAARLGSREAATIMARLKITHPDLVNEHLKHCTPRPHEGIIPQIKKFFYGC
ncbi:MAG: sel1 repeat family protein [Magnetococcales bacterium]|nr:sel1 repeat family protein [Magnetococcales bacterium]